VRPPLLRAAPSPNDPLGYDRETTFTYDKLNRKSIETRLNVEYSYTTTQYSGARLLVPRWPRPRVIRRQRTLTDAVGNQTSSTVNNVLVNNTATSATTYNYYDTLGRLIAIAAPSRIEAMPPPSFRWWS